MLLKNNVKAYKWKFYVEELTPRCVIEVYEKILKKFLS